MRLGVIGAKGKMGKRIVYLASQDPFFQNILDLCTKKKLKEIPNLDLIIDFSTKEAFSLNLALAEKIKCPFVIGTTGLDAPFQKALLTASRKIPIFWAPNFSLGMGAAVFAAKLVSSLLGSFDSHIEEVHHLHKKDTPSGSALALKEAVEKGNPLKITPIKSIREGEEIGKHTLVFSSDEEALKICHEAFSRDVFAKGALAAAKFLKRQKPGLYTMENLLLNGS